MIHKLLFEEVVIIFRISTIMQNSICILGNNITSVILKIKILSETLKAFTYNLNKKRWIFFEK